jgi:hypothetical protein
MALNPLEIVLSSYNRQIEAVGDLIQLLAFSSTGGYSHLDRKQAEGIVRAFKECFLKYLSGTGHMPEMVPDYVTEEEFKLHISDKPFRARITLRQLTDSWLLPVGDGSQSKIKVRPS